MKKILILLLLAPPLLSVPQFLNSMQIEKKYLSVPGRLGNISIFNTDNGFEVEEANSTRVAVPSYRISKDIRNMKTHQLASFIRNGYIAVNQSTDGEYSLDMRRRLNAGGPILATALYGITKGVCYGVGLAAAGAGIAFAAPSVAAGSANVVLTVIGGYLGGTTGATAGVVSSFVAGGPATVAAASTTVSGVAAATGSTLGVFAAIEGLANMAFLAGMAAPTP